jgi:hypothetical protein
VEGFVAARLDEFDRGKLSRRHLIEVLAFAATSACATDSVNAEGASLKVALVNDISYSCLKFATGGDRYSDLQPGSCACDRPQNHVRRGTTAGYRSYRLYDR